MQNLTNGAFRLFFPGAALFAAISIPLWLAQFSGAAIVGPDDAFRWHQHEMLFGYLGAALTGFLLTAIPNWTGRPALVGTPLVLVFGLWLVARLGFAVLPVGPLQAGLALIFPFALAAIASREILAGGNRRNLPVAGLIWLFALSDLVFLLGYQAVGLRMGFGLALVMITLIGGRVTPAFSRNWLKAKGSDVVIPGFDSVDKAAMILTILAVLGWVVLAEHWLTGGLALAAALMLTARLLRWKGWAVASEPLLITMHLAYAWLPVSMAFLADMAFGGSVSQLQVVHAIGAGAVGSMTMIVMMRAVLGHSNRPLSGNWLDALTLAAVHVGAVLRVGATAVDDSVALLHLSGTLWALGFALFFLRYGYMATQPRQ